MQNYLKSPQILLISRKKLSIVDTSTPHFVESNFIAATRSTFTHNANHRFVEKRKKNRYYDTFYQRFLMDNSSDRIA